MRRIEAVKATRKVPRQADPSVTTYKEQTHSFHPQQLPNEQQQAWIGVNYKLN